MLAILDAHEKALFEEVDECVWQENVTSTFCFPSLVKKARHDW